MAEASLPGGSASGDQQRGSVIDETDYLDYERYYAEYDDDEEVEDYFFSGAAGRARIVIGNRRHGPNGYLSSGRIQARPSGATQQQNIKVDFLGDISWMDNQAGDADMQNGCQYSWIEVQQLCN